MSVLFVASLLSGRRLFAVGEVDWKQTRDVVEVYSYLIFPRATISIVWSFVCCFLCWFLGTVAHGVVMPSWFASRLVEPGRLHR